MLTPTAHQSPVPTAAYKRSRWFGLHCEHATNTTTTMADADAPPSERR